jgi:two-component system, response regulator RegA
MTGASTPRRGLLVDDDDLYLRTLLRSLQKRGFDAVLARNSADALAAAQTHRPDFALIDLRLGVDSGLGLIEPLRAIRGDMRILLVTGYASIATAVEAIKRGADNYLMKPVTAEVIVRALRHDPEPQAEPENTMVPLARVEWEHIQQALYETHGNISAAARLLGMHRRSLQRKLAKRPGPERKSTDAGE